MAYDQELAERVRFELEGAEGLSERAMFGGLAFMLDGNMAVGVGGQGGLMVRCDPDDTDRFCEEAGVERFGMHGKPARGWLDVSPEALAADEALARWVAVGVAYARALPPKQPK